MLLVQQMPRPCVMPHVVQQCSAYFCCNHIENGVLLVAKAVVKLWPPATVCLSQGTALHLAAAGSHVAVVQTLLLNAADLEARDIGVSCSSLYNNAVHTFVAT